MLEPWRHFDWMTIGLILSFAVLSYLGISGANPSYGEPFKQIVWYGIGLVLLLAVQWLDGRTVMQLTPLFYGTALFLLLVVLVLGSSTGEMRWLEYKGIKLQPAEIAKLATILMGARWFALREEEGRESERFWDLWPFFALFAVPAVLILLEPDLGNTIVLLFVLMAVLAVAARVRHVLAVIGIYAAGVLALGGLYWFANPLFFKIIKVYQWNRITAFLVDPPNPSDPDQYQIYMSLLAIGSGEMSGKAGSDAYLLTQHHWVPEAQTDFIFAVIAEHYGFLGGATVVLLYFFLMYRLIRIGMEVRTPFERYVVAGLVGMWTFQIFENIGMTIKLTPITGITLPFLSYGGSSLTTNLFALGLVLAFGWRARRAPRV
ncbi:MAG: FtsW/RodA/SpoVE family cell cycle protein [Hydrogenibacillus sp.]|nr:FtsW/RodA/SpoVE family cell cycle protein [Hydrogenibacillus sp.]